MHIHRDRTINTHIYVQTHVSDLWAERRGWVPKKEGVKKYGRIREGNKLNYQNSFKRLSMTLKPLTKFEQVSKPFFVSTYSIKFRVITIFHKGVWRCIED